MILTYIVPIALQQALVSINFILDNLMVSQVSSEAIAALGSGNRFLFIIRFGIIAFSIGNAVISAQLSKSADNKEEIGRTLLVSIITSLLFSLVFIVAYFTNREFIISTFSSNFEIREIAGQYIDRVIFSSITLSVMLSLITTLRSLGTLIIPMIGSAIGLLVNFILGYIFIFGNFGFSALGLQGAALSTITSEVIALAFLLTASFVYHPQIFKFDLSKINLVAFKSYLKISLIILFSHIVWAAQGMIMHNLFGRLGIEQLAAYSAMFPIENIMFDIFSAFGFSTLIFVGRRLASDKKEKAYSFSSNMLKIGTMSGAIIGLTLAIFSRNIASLYSFSAQEMQSMVIFLRIFGLFLAVKLAANILYNGILRAGGDMTFILVLTILLGWGLIIPITHIGHYFYGWNLYYIYVAIHGSEIVTLSLMLLRFKSKKWMNNLVK